MEFETSLTKEQVKIKLTVYAKPLKQVGFLSENQFFSKWNDDDSFYLLRTGGAFSVRPVLPFVGKIEQRENTNLIKGNFALAKSAKVMLACFFGLAWILFLFGCFLNPNFDLSGKIVVFIAIAIWTALGYAFFRYVPGLFQKKQQAAVIEFIEKHLVG